MRGGGTRTTLAGACLDGSDATTLADETSCMEKQLVRIADILDIEQFDFRIGLGVEVLVHILQDILDANLLTVAYRPHTVELQSLDDGTLQDKDRCGAAAADEIGSLGVEVWNG
jgi:hypothetical protein